MSLRNIVNRTRRPLAGISGQKWVTLWIAVLIGVAVLGMNSARATDEPFVYDPEIQETVPSDLQAGLEDAIGDPDSATGDGVSPVSPPASEPVDAFGPDIATVDTEGDTPPPTSPDVFSPTNAYARGDSESARVVYAGADGSDPSSGMIIDNNLTYSDGSGDETPITSAGTGALKIIGYTWTSLLLSSDSGQTGTYDLSSDSLTMSTMPLGNIIFYSDRNDPYNTGEIYSMSPDGSNQTRLTNNSLDDEEAGFSPARTKISYTEDTDGTYTNYDVWVMTADGSGKVNISNQAGASDNEDPAISPDDTRVAFDSNRTGHYEIYVAPIGGGPATRLTNGPGDQQSPVWSPDGSEIAYTSTGLNAPYPYYQAAEDLYLMNADGSAPRDLSNHSEWGLDVAPSWSPDGTKIAYSCVDSNEIWNICTISAQGGSPTRLTSVGGNDVPSGYSPDGSKILFQANRADGWHVWVMNADGSDEAELTATQSGFTLGAGWSPDGSKIVYTAQNLTDGTDDVWTVNPDGSGAQKLTSSSVVDCCATW